MTAQSGRGQGGEPYEGVVLPANGDPWTPEQQQQVAQTHTQPPAGAPWGEPWGPGSQAAAQATVEAPSSGPALPSSSPEPPPPPPPQTAPGSAPGAYEAQGAHGAHGAQGTQNAQAGPPPASPPPQAPPMPSTPPPTPPYTPPHTPPGTPPGQQPLPESGGPSANGQPAYGAGPLPPLNDPGQGPGPGGSQSHGRGRHSAPQPPQVPQQPPSVQPLGQSPAPVPGAISEQPGQVAQEGAPLPPPYEPGTPAGGYGAGPVATQMLTPQGQQPPQQPAMGGQDAPGSARTYDFAAPHWPEQAGYADSEATQYLSAQPPQQPQPQPQSQSQLPAQQQAQTPVQQTQQLQRPPAQADSEATQMLPPTAPGPGDAGAGAFGGRSPLPPEAAGGAHAAYAGVPPQSAPGAPGASPAQRRQPPAGFEALFRDEPAPSAASGGAGSAVSGEPGSTQSLPLFDQAASNQQPQYGSSSAGAHDPGAPNPPHGPHGGRTVRHGGGHGARGGLGSRLSTPVLIAIAVVVLAGAGVGVGLAVSGGDEDGGKTDGGSAVTQGQHGSSESGAVKAQAKGLDALLGDSNNSRSAVVRSVTNIKHCQKLGKAASDLRASAKQRNGLVTRLGKLHTDRLPNHRKLTSSLTRAWKSSAAADLHYAQWASQAGSKKVCHKGKARSTGQAGAGNRSSGEATTAKKRAAGLWNPIARKYGLKPRQFGQL